MKFTIIAIFLITGSLAQASAEANQAADLVRVRHLADKKIQGEDVRKIVQVYDNVDGNPCAEAGINYLVKVQTRKSEFGPNGAIDSTRTWSDFNTYWISKAQLDQNGDLSDAPCAE